MKRIAFLAACVTVAAAVACLAGGVPYDLSPALQISNISTTTAPTVATATQPQNGYLEAIDLYVSGAGASVTSTVMVVISNNYGMVQAYSNAAFCGSAIVHPRTTVHDFGGAATNAGTVLARFPVVGGYIRLQGSAASGTNQNVRAVPILE